MTIQWTLVAAFLYLELAFIFLLLLPIITPKLWQYVFYSRMCKVLASKANVYFTVFIIVLIFFFLDSIREMLLYSNKSSVDLGQELQIHLKLFRSQRNYYISGFTVFLWLVIRRLVTLVLTEADLLEENESAMKRAQNATEAVEKILKKKEEVEKEKSLITQVSMMEANDLRRAIEEAEKELNQTKKTVEDVKQKSLEITKEYEELLQRHTDLLDQERKKKEEEDRRVQERKMKEEEERRVQERKMKEEEDKRIQEASKVELSGSKEGKEDKSENQKEEEEEEEEEEDEEEEEEEEKSTSKED